MLLLLLCLLQNLWFNGPTYDEENKGGTHESSVLASSFAVTPTTTPNVIPACPPLTNGAVTAHGQPMLVAAAVLLAALLSLLL